jgi:predicted nucleic acid-binding protein
VNWVERLTGRTVAIDSAPLIYFMERHPVYFELVRPFFEALGRGDFKALTSVVTVTEVLVHPLRHGSFNLVNIYRDFFTQYLPVIPVTVEIAELAARLRAENGLRTPDAIEVATAVNQGAGFFLTNDVRLDRLNQLEVLVLSDLND